MSYSIIGVKNRKFGQMADEANNNDFLKDEGLLLWNAASLFLLGIADRFRFNRNRYAEEAHIPDSSQLIPFCDELLRVLHAYRALHSHWEETGNSSLLYGLFLMIHKIESIIYVIHHSLLELNPDSIIKPIQLLDAIRKCWLINEFSTPSDLPDLVKTESSILEVFELKLEIERLIDKSF